jgi:DNA-binding MarR family transcriptional regulator
MAALAKTLHFALMEKCDMSFPQFMFLTSVQNHPDKSQRMLASFRKMTPAAISKQVDSLIDKGWVIKKVKKGKRLEYSLSLSPIGKKELKKAEKVLEAHYKKILGNKVDKETMIAEKKIDDWLRLLNTEEKEICSI